MCPKHCLLKQSANRTNQTNKTNITITNLEINGQTRDTEENKHEPN